MEIRQNRKERYSLKLGGFIFNALLAYFSVSVSNAGSVAHPRARTLGVASATNRPAGLQGLQPPGQAGSAGRRETRRKVIRSADEG